MIRLTTRLSPYLWRDRDEGACARAAAVLEKSPYLPLRTLQCNYERGYVTLRGDVPTFYLKQLAQTLIGDVAGPDKILNLIHVTPLGAQGRARSR